MPLLPVSNDDASDDVASGTSGSHASSKDTYLYCRVALGSQARLTRVVKVRNGAAKWRSGLLAFAVPVPMRDRAVRMEVWQTTSSGKKGRAAFVAQPHLFTILPDVGGIAPDLHQRRTLEVPLVAMNGTKTAAALSITVAVADLDSRRALYLQELLEHREIEEMQAGQSGAVARLQSTTRELTAREMKLLGKLTAEKFAEHEASRQRRAQAAATLVDAAHYGARKMAHFASRVQARLGGRIAEEEESLAQLDPLSSLREALPAIAPLACLRLKLNSVKIIRAAAGPVATGFCIFRCGANWGKTPPVKVISGAMDFETWTVEIPVFDPATVLVVGVFEKMGLHRSRGLAVQMVGKLRVRLSTLQPDQDISAELPLLSERKKGAHRVGVASMGLLLKFTSANARLASLVAPPLPKEVFVHSLDTAPVQKLMNAARRRMVAQWLSPTIPRDLMMAMEDTEREEFAMSRLKANARRIRLALFVLRRGALAFRAVQSWERPYMSGAVCAVAVTAVYVPWLVYGLGLLAAAAACHASIPANVGFPEGMEHDPPEVDSDDEETGSRLDLNANSVNPYTQLKRKLERLQGITLTVQNVMDDIATTLERLIALATWQDPLATMILVWTLGIIGTALLLLGVKPLLAGLALFVLRPPQLRTPWTPPPVALFARLPSRADRTV